MQLLNKLFSHVLLMNELGGNANLKYVFSDADGYRTGRAGYSFGLSQFDIENNWDGINLLQSIGFSPKELKELMTQADTDYVNQVLDKKLQTVSAKLTIDKHDMTHANTVVLRTRNIVNQTGILCTVGGFLALTDYHNQFYISENGKMHNFLKSYSKVMMLTIDDITKFKLENTKWGVDRPDDVQRRSNNIYFSLSENGRKPDEDLRTY